MPTSSHEDHDPTLPPPGSRWGSGAQSVLPYLTKSLQARPASAGEPAREHRQGVETRQPARPSTPAT